MMHRSLFLSSLIREAEATRESAALSGMMGDNGASDIELQVAVYRAGTNDTVPDVWREKYNKFIKTLDPEYAEYRRLKEKFND